MPAQLDRPDRLAAYRLTMQDVEDALRRSNLEVPAGRIESNLREFNVTARNRPAAAPQFANGDPDRERLPGANRDVARVRQGPADERSACV